MTQLDATPETHPFLTQPHRTLIVLSSPVLLSLIAEPLTGLVDTAFITRLGAVPLAGLGIGTVALSSVFWIFNFLSIGTQTEVAQSIGQKKRANAIRVTSLALVMSVAFGVLMFMIGSPGAAFLSRLMGAEAGVLSNATQYIQIRLFGGPAVLVTLAGFGALRGMQDMRTPLWIAVTINILNMVLDAPLIFGWGPVPALGVGGSALATVISQWLGALWAISATIRRLGFTWDIHLDEALSLIKIGGDLFIRTGVLTLFLLLSTRIANQISVEAGAAHQAIRQVWFFTALVLEAFAMTAQSLVGYFLGSAQVTIARQVAKLSTYWSIGTGIALAALMLLSTQPVIGLLVPQSAAAVFIPAWVVAAITQPINSLAFISDGIHWGTGDYRYLRNGMLFSTAFASIAMLMIDTGAARAFMWVWAAIGLWIVLRSIVGIGRIWPGFGGSPLRLQANKRQPTNPL